MERKIKASEDSVSNLRDWSGAIHEAAERRRAEALKTLADMGAPLFESKPDEGGFVNGFWRGDGVVVVMIRYPGVGYTPHSLHTAQRYDDAFIADLVRAVSAEVTR